MRKLHYTTVITVVFFILFSIPTIALAFGDGMIPDEAIEMSEEDLKSNNFSWEKSYPQIIRDNAMWNEYKPQAITFYYPERGLLDYFSIESNLHAFQNYAHNSRLVSSFTRVFSALEHIERATSFTIFQFMVDLVAPITFGLWDYISTYWWELFFTLGLAYVLVGLIRRRFIWMLIRFGLMLMFSGLLVALFSPGFELWDDTLKKAHNAIGEHTGYVLHLAVQDTSVQTTGNYATDVANTMYYLNVVQPFTIGQFGEMVSNDVINEYFSIQYNFQRQRYVEGYLTANQTDITSLMHQRGEISWRMKWVNWLAFGTYASLGYVSALLEILLVVQIIPLMISLIFASLPTDESLGEVRKRVGTMAKLLLGKLVLAFVVSVGTYVNVFLLSKVNAGEMTIQDAQFLIIITYAGTIYYAFKLLKWIWASRDYAVDKTKEHVSKTKNLVANAVKFKMFKNMMSESKSSTSKPKTKRKVARSKPTEKPRKLTPRDRIQAKREEAGGRRRTSSVRTTPRHTPMARR